MPCADLRKADGHTGAWSSIGRRVGCETETGIIQLVFKVRGEGGGGVDSLEPAWKDDSAINRLSSLGSYLVCHAALGALQPKGVGVSFTVLLWRSHDCKQVKLFQKLSSGADSPWKGLWALSALFGYEDEFG